MDYWWCYLAHLLQPQKRTTQIIKKKRIDSNRHHFSHVLLWIKNLIWTIENILNFDRIFFIIDIFLYLMIRCAHTFHFYLHHKTINKKKKKWFEHYKRCIYLFTGLTLLSSDYNVPDLLRSNNNVLSPASVRFSFFLLVVVHFQFSYSHFKSLFSLLLVQIS